VTQGNQDKKEIIMMIRGNGLSAGGPISLNKMR